MNKPNLNVPLAILKGRNLIMSFECLDFEGAPFGKEPAFGMIPRVVGNAKKYVEECGGMEELKPHVEKLEAYIDKYSLLIQ